MSAGKITSKNEKLARLKNSEQEAFGLRLKAALQAAGHPESPTQLARQFNLRFSGHPISAHAARKWLRGEAIPTQEKLRTLARWLGVTAEWLRFDTAGSKVKSTSGEIEAKMAPADLQLLEELLQLDEEDRVIARELIRLLVRLDRNK